MSTWSERAFCPCGWSDEPSSERFGSPSSTIHAAHAVVAASMGMKCTPSRYARRQVGTWKLFGLFERPKWQAFYETREGQELLRLPIIDGRAALPTTTTD